MIEPLLPLLVSIKQTWRRLLIFKTLLFLNPSFVLQRTLWPRPAQPRSDIPPANASEKGHITAHEKPTQHLTASPTTINMPPLPRQELPRIVVYFQTHHDPQGNPIPLLPLLQPGIRLTHLNVAAFHINQKPDPRQIITLNDHHPTNPRFNLLWAQAKELQRAGVKVLGMLGGAAKGAYCRETLDSEDEAVFERYYAAVRDDVVRANALDGLDLDVEEEMSLGGVIRLIDRLRADFGPDFIITLAPVAPALLDVRRNLSGFDYEALEVMRGRDIAFYNCQFCE